MFTSKNIRFLLLELIIPFFGIPTAFATFIIVAASTKVWQLPAVKTIVRDSLLPLVYSSLHPRMLTNGCSSLCSFSFGW
jgi:hypothetical protein